MFLLLATSRPSRDINIHRRQTALRCCATFLIGSIIYAIVYAMLKNVQLYYGPMADSSIVAFMLIFIADCATMAYIYKSYYGRYLHREFEENEENWVLNKETHKYERQNKDESRIDKAKNT